LDIVLNKNNNKKEVNLTNYIGIGVENIDRWISEIQIFDRGSRRDRSSASLSLATAPQSQS